MNLFWFIRYLAITFQCVTPVLNAVWSTRNRLQHELDLLLIPLHIQFTEWGYPIEERKALVTEEVINILQLTTSLSSVISVNIRTKYDELAVDLYGEIFVVKLTENMNFYFRSPHRNGTQIFRNRSEWVQSFLHRLIGQTLGPTFSNKTINANPWTRVDAVWTCTP